jgi:two-component system phosphate regulon sensor histidine kinase PhoR
LSKGIARELTWIITSLWIAIFIAWVSDQWFWVLGAYLLLYLGRHLYSVSQFEKWIKGHSRVSYPPSSGFWGEVSHLVSRKQRSLEKHANLQLYKSEQFLAASMAMPDALVSLNETHQIEWFNRSARKLFGLKQSDIGRRIENLYRHPDFVTYLKRGHYDQSLVIEGVNQRPRVFSFKILPYHRVHKLLIVKDIHELYNLAQIRRDFVANASHELRTPLTVLSGYLEVMQDSVEPDSPWVKPLKSMAHQSDRMQAIINDLLTLSAMESETLTGDEGPVAIGTLLTQMQESMDQMTTEHSVSFEIDPALQIVGYEDPLKSVLTNLVSNAIRYTPSGGSITVRWYEDAKGAHYEVEDTGIGIAQAHIGRLTERFYRVDTARSRETGGTGLGLAIVKHILERHQAKLVIKSQVQKGSIFRCDFSPSRIVRKPISESEK